MSGTRPGVAIVDYGAGNLFGLTRALERAGASVAVVRSADELAGALAVVVPGVGASGPAMRRLRRRGLDGALRHAVDGGAWYLGICLGMQLLFERSAEDGARGLAWLAGRVEPLVDAPRLPHIGWNAVEQRRPHPLLDGMPGSAPAYFVHSYAAAPADPGVVIAETEYGARFASAIARDRILGLQFHPEKSGPTGQLLLRRFVAMVADRAGDNDGQGSLVARAPVLIGGTRSAAPADAARIVPGAIPSAAPAPR